MNRTPDVERVLRDYLADDGAAAPDHILDLVEERISVQRQRRSWRLLRRLPMQPLIKLGIAAAAVLVIAVIGYNLLPSQPSVGGQSSPSPIPTPSPTLTPSPTPGSTPMALHDGQLLAGRYLMQPFDDLPSLTFTADLPAGWHGLAPVGAVGPRGSEGPDGIAFATLRVDGLFSDPCHWDLDGTGNPEQPGDVVVGPDVDDLSAALDASAAYESSGVSWSGFPKTAQGIGEVAGHQITIWLPASIDIESCDKDEEGRSRYQVFSGKHGGLYAQGNGNIWDIHIVAVDGIRVVVVVEYYEGTPAADREAAESIVGSFDFVP